MRVLMLAAACCLAVAPFGQTVAKVKPAAKAAKAAAPAGPSLSASYAALPLAERIAIQTDLVWTGDYNGLLDGEFNEGAVAAVKAFQKRHRGKETGVLNLQEREDLAYAAKPPRDRVGWRMVTDPVTGARLGVPLRLAPQTSTGRNGTRWFSAQGQVQIETFRVGEPGTTLAAVFERMKKEPNERRVEYQVLKPDFFVLSGMQSLKKFYVRGAIKDGEVRGITVLYDQANELVMDRAAVVMSSAFVPFPAAGAAPRRVVDYGTGIVVGADGFVLTHRDLTEGCQVIVAAGVGNAERVADDEATGLALLRVYGAKGLKTAPLGAGAPPDGPVTIVGVADPLGQAGGAAVSASAARLAGGKIDPAPGPGFAGAAVTDAQHRVVGMIAARPAVVAGSGGGAAGAIIPLDKMQAFLATQPDLDSKATLMEGEKSDLDAIKRVICVRK